MAEKNFGLEDVYINTNLDRTKWIRVSIETGRMCKYNPETGEYDTPVPIFPEITMDEELAAAIATHSALPNAHHPVNAGITGTKTLGNYKFTFTNGLLTGFEPV